MGTFSKMMLLARFLPLLPFVWGHGGMVWPPIWQNSHPIPLEKMWTNKVSSKPMVVDPRSGTNITELLWLTDEAFLGGVGQSYRGTGGPATNAECEGRYEHDCKWTKTPWTSPGRAPSLGGGCGIYGGHANGCWEVDNRAPGSSCDGPGVGKYHLYAYGSAAIDIEFPNALTTDWVVGQPQEVAWSTGGGHRGGYTYRLCKMPEGGKKDLTEECFANNVLKFSSHWTFIRRTGHRGHWNKIEQWDLTSGTYPEGSAWRHVPMLSQGANDKYFLKDMVDVPSNLPLGEYVLSLRWDAIHPQVWVSCANVRLVAAQPRK